MFMMLVFAEVRMLHEQTAAVFMLLHVTFCLFHSFAGDLESSRGHGFPDVDSVLDSSFSGLNSAYPAQSKFHRISDLNIF